MTPICCLDICNGL